MRILSIETSCDETALALVEADGLRVGKAGISGTPRFRVLAHLISSQIKVHAPFGGVVPNLAKREHLKHLPKLYRALQKSPAWERPDTVAVTVGPGLEPALWTGIAFAKNLSEDLGVPLVGANHMEGHLYSNWLTSPGKNQKSGIQFPAVTLVVSGGHTILLVMQSLTKWKKLGETRDDAAGEAFDKVARMLGLPYPGGPAIAKLAKGGDCKAIDFPQPMRNTKNYDFSFSGLKTSALYYVRDNPRVKKADVAASFERAATDVLAYKTERAVREYEPKSVLLCGGVAANACLRKKLGAVAKAAGARFHAPVMEFNTDNAAMIAAAAYIGSVKVRRYRIIAQANLNL